MLQVNEVEFAYQRGRPILRGASLTLQEGESLCLLGPNGAGKTTLLRCLLGLSKPQRGSIRLNGVDLQCLSVRQRAHYMAYIPQGSQITFAYTAREVVMMGRLAHLAYGASPTEADKTVVAETFQRLGIQRLAEKVFHELSGGERQMVLVARALSQQTPLLVMDEPTANLDYCNQVKILRAVRELADDGYSILMTSHDPGHALLASSRAALLAEGRIIDQGLPDKIVTGEKLTRLYEVKVWVTETSVYSEGKPVKVCVPSLDRASENQ